MIYKLIIVLMILFSTLFSIKAQFSIGINAGYNINHLETNISNRSYTKNTNENGYNYGLKLSYHLTHVLNMQTGLDLMQKNYSVIRTGDYLGIYEIFDNSYFQIPITAQFKLFGIRRMSFLINTGVYGAYWFYSKITGTIPNILNSTETISNDGQITQNLTLTNFVEKYQFNSKVDNRFEYGFNTGLELNYKVNNNHSIFGGLNFYQSLTDQQKKYMVNQISKRNQTLCIAIGYSYKFFTD